MTTNKPRRSTPRKAAPPKCYRCQEGTNGDCLCDECLGILFPEYTHLEVLLWLSLYGIKGPRAGDLEDALA